VGLVDLDAEAAAGAGRRRSRAEWGVGGGGGWKGQAAQQSRAETGVERASGGSRVRTRGKVGHPAVLYYCGRGGFLSAYISFKSAFISHPTGTAVL
jgi:hypothetical protein